MKLWVAVIHLGVHGAAMQVTGKVGAVRRKTTWLHIIFQHSPVCALCFQSTLTLVVLSHFSR